MIEWVFKNYLEILGVLFSLAYLFFSIKQNILLWPMGIIGSAIYVFVFYQAKFYADMGLNGYYFFISIYGWIVWSTVKQSTGEKMPVRRTGFRMGLILIAVTIILFLTIGLLLDKYTDSPLPYWDAFTTAGSITATWMLARKFLEHWLFWITVDTVSIGLYIYKGLYPTVILFLVYTTMAVIGFIAWKKEMKTSSS